MTRIFGYEEAFVVVDLPAAITSPAVAQVVCDGVPPHSSRTGASINEWFAWHNVMLASSVQLNHVLFDGTDWILDSATGAMSIAGTGNSTLSMTNESFAGKTLTLAGNFAALRWERMVSSGTFSDTFAGHGVIDNAAGRDCATMSTKISPWQRVRLAKRP